MVYLVLSFETICLYKLQKKFKEISFISENILKIELITKKLETSNYTSFSY